MASSVEKVQKHKTLYTIATIVLFLLSALLAYAEVYGVAIGFFFFSIIILVQLKTKNTSSLENKDS